MCFGGGGKQQAAPVPMPAPVMPMAPVVPQAPAPVIAPPPAPLMAQDYRPALQAAGASKKSDEGKVRLKKKLSTGLATSGGAAGANKGGINV